MAYRGDGRILTIAQQKGGAGKTTLAAHLATEFLHRGYRVALIDIDPQASLTHWVEMRKKTFDGETGFLFDAMPGWRLKREAERLTRTADIVIIDSPPHMDTEAKIAMRASDLTLVPLQPSPMDLWASKSTLITAREEKVPMMIVLNRVNPRAKLAEDIQSKLNGLNVDIRVANTVLGNRVIYAAALLTGKGVNEAEASGIAAQEIESLADEIRKHTAFKGLRKAA